MLADEQNVFDRNQKHLLADMQNVLDEHEMFEKFGGGETSKQGHAVETISCQANNVSQFRQALRAGRGLVVMTLSVQCRIWKVPGFSLDLLDMEGICPPIWGNKVLMGGPLRGDIDIMGGPNFDRLYHTLKVLFFLLLLCTSQFQA